MPRPDKYHSEAQELEKRVFRIFLTVSVLVHIAVFFLDPAGWFNRANPLPPEWVIEADISLPDLPEEDKTLKPEKKELAEPEPVNQKKMLPQLPKRFDVKDSEPEPVAAEELPPKPEKPVEKKVPEKKSPEAEKQIVHDDEATKQKRDDIMKRLEREVLRQRKLEQKKERVKKNEEKAISRLLDSRKKSLEKLSQANENHPYVRELKKTIRQNYSVPAVYKNQQLQQPVVMLQIDKSGDIKSVEMVRSSKIEALDRLAVKNIYEMSPFPRPPKELWGQPFQVHLGDTAM